VGAGTAKRPVVMINSRELIIFKSRRPLSSEAGTVADMRGGAGK